MPSNIGQVIVIEYSRPEQEDTSQMIGYCAKVLEGVQYQPTAEGEGHEMGGRGILGHRQCQALCFLLGIGFGLDPLWKSDVPVEPAGPPAVRHYRASNLELSTAFAERISEFWIDDATPEPMNVYNSLSPKARAA